jgi:hypothetical protein
MHEINTAAEAITNAADADANIIFGATINPELEGEIIITVVATGFDASYFANRVLPGRSGTDEKSDADEPKPKKRAAGDKPLVESDVAGLDMTLDDNHTDAADFTSESPMPNIWSIDSDDHDDSNGGPVIGTPADDELERPSFLRRLKKRRNDDSNEESNSTSDK